MSKWLYIYVVDRDFGFAPNPFHGYCTLATCKPQIRSTARVGDWVMGVGGSRLKAMGKCIYLMKVTQVLTFSQYWEDPRFQIKKPVRNGSLVMMVGDNIYHRDTGDEFWIQEDSHHSNADGSPNLTNMVRDTSSANVLVSDHFYYFGQAAPDVDLGSIQYKNHIGHGKKPISDDSVSNFIEMFISQHKKSLNRLGGDPFNFSLAKKRVDQSTGAII